MAKQIIHRDNTPQLDLNPDTMRIYLYWKGNGMHTMIAATEYKDSQVDAAVYALQKMIKEIDSPTLESKRDKENHV